MTDHNPIMKLVEIVNDQLKQGRNEAEIVNQLVASGLDEKKAWQVVETVKASRSSHTAGIVRFFVSSLLIVSTLTFTVYLVLGEANFVAQAKLLSAIFFFCFILFSVLAGIKGKAVVYARLINSGFWLISSFMLMSSMFLHPGWDSKWFGTGGGWRGQLVSFGANIIYNIGAGGIAYILVLVSFIVLLLFWAEFHRIKTQNYDAT
ncbi:hypothetical protein ACFL07_05855 [Pseudomonadota bacterium]